MSDALASFRDLKGVGPAIEARLHEAGVYSWQALAEVVDALGSIRRGSGDTLRDLSPDCGAAAQAGAYSSRRRTASGARRSSSGSRWRPGPGNKSP